MKPTLLSLPQTRDAILRFRGRETIVSGHSDLPKPPFPIAPTATTLRHVTLGPQPQSIMTQKQNEVHATRETELTKRRGHARTTDATLCVRGVDAGVTVDIGADDFVGAYRDDDWSIIIIKTLEGETLRRRDRCRAPTADPAVQARGHHRERQHPGDVRPAADWRRRHRGGRMAPARRRRRPNAGPATCYMRCSRIELATPRSIEGRQTPFNVRLVRKHTYTEGAVLDPVGLLVRKPECRPDRGDDRRP